MKKQKQAVKQVNKTTIGEIIPTWNLGFGYFKQDFTAENTGVEGYTVTVLMPFCRIVFSEYLVVDTKHNIANLLNSN